MIEINNLSSFRISRARFSTVAKIVLKGENRVREKISLAFVNKAEIKKLNKKFRNKNRETDVLSFELDNGYLGEVVICPEVVKTEKEQIKVFIHGILHLLGYEHEKSKKESELMEKKQEKYFIKVFN